MILFLFVCGVICLRIVIRNQTPIDIQINLTHLDCRDKRCVNAVILTPGQDIPSNKSPLIFLGHFSSEKLKIISHLPDSYFHNNVQKGCKILADKAFYQAAPFIVKCVPNPPLPTKELILVQGDESKRVWFNEIEIKESETLTVIADLHGELNQLKKAVEIQLKMES